MLSSLELKLGSAERPEFLLLFCGVFRCLADSARGYVAAKNPEASRPINADFRSPLDQLPTKGPFNSIGFPMLFRQAFHLFLAFHVHFHGQITVNSVVRRYHGAQRLKRVHKRRKPSFVSKRIYQLSRAERHCKS